GLGRLAAAPSLVQKVSPKPRRNKATLNKATLEGTTLVSRNSSQAKRFTARMEASNVPHDTPAPPIPLRQPERFPAKWEPVRRIKRVKGRTGRGGPMVEVPITIACGNYDRTRAIRDGRVKVEGCAATYLPLYPEEIFFRAFRYQEFDVSELSFSSYIRTVA